MHVHVFRCRLIREFCYNSPRTCSLPIPSLVVKHCQLGAFLPFTYTHWSIIVNNHLSVVCNALIIYCSLYSTFGCVYWSTWFMYVFYWFGHQKVFAKVKHVRHNYWLCEIVRYVMLFINLNWRSITQHVSEALWEN